MGLHCYTRLSVRILSCSRKFASQPMYRLPRMPLLYKSNLSLSTAALLTSSPTLMQIALLQTPLYLETSKDEDPVTLISTLLDQVI